MSDPSSPPELTLEQFPEKLTVVRLGPGAEVPAWAESSSLFSITATARETSLVCASRSVPRKARQQGPFTAFAVQGPLDFGLTGVLAWLLWLGVHILYLTGFKNRVTAVLHWAVSFVGRGRQERTATEQQIFGRLAMNRLDHGAMDLVSAPPRELTPEEQQREEARRAELEAIAAEEARLTDKGKRGVKIEADA